MSFTTIIMAVRVLTSTTPRTTILLIATTLQLLALRPFRSPTPWFAPHRGRLFRSARIRLAKSERVPNVDLFYRRLQGTRENAYDVGLRIPIPLFDRKRGRVREAESELRSVEASLESTRNQIGLELRSRELVLERALESASVLQSDVLPKVEASLRGAEVRYAAGDTSLPDVLAVRREATAARLQYLGALRAVIEAWTGLMSGPVIPR